MGKGRRGMYHRGMICRYHERRECGLLTWMCGAWSDPLDPIKLMGYWSHLIQQLTCYLPALLLFSSFTDNVFDQQLYL